MADPTAEQLIKRADAMSADRSGFESHWSEVRKLAYPSGDQFTSSSSPGAKAHDDVLDGSAELANEFMAAGFVGIMSNPSTKWMKLRAKNERINREPGVAEWLEDSTNRMLAVFSSPRHRFPTAQYEKHLDWGSYGTGGMVIDDVPGLGPLFRARPLKELLLAEGELGTVDTVYRRFDLSARQAVQKWGKNAGPKTEEKAGDINKQDEKSEFLHCIFPRTDAVPGRIRGADRKIASIHVNLSEKLTIGVSGYFEMPIVTPRFGKRADEVYGRGRGMTALGDIKMLQRAMKSTIRGAEKTINPPLIVPDDGMMSPFRLTPGGLNVVRPDMLARGIVPKALQTNARPDLGEDFMEGVRKRIDAAFYKQLLQTLQDPRMTATQVLKIIEEAQRILGPTLGRLQTEDLGPTIDRVYAIMLRGGMFLPIPDALEDEGLEVEYLSAVAQGQRLSEATAIASTMDILAPIRAAQPEIDDNFDGDKVFRHVASLLGWPLNTLRGDREVIRMRQARAEAEAQEFAGQDAKDLIGPAAQALPAMAEMFNLASARPEGTA